MGQDTYINATIFERSTGKRISEEWFTVYWDCHDTAKVTAMMWRQILSKYTDISRLEDDCHITFPQTALREMTSCLFSYAVVPECDRYDYLWKKGFWDVENRGRINDIPYRQQSEKLSFIRWNSIQDDEETFLRGAMRLREFICELDRIHYENNYMPLPASNCDGLESGGKCLLPDSFILDKSDLNKYKANPQSYEWRFEFVDSY